ncbi:adhesive plaque matrix protein 2-like [Mytilus trossulus]|uniref:adhesive plaque matrix protein 2-like n=1 Tax=Mytilus trossulus TaxID=6551 RepID=UPI003004440F
MLYATLMLSALVVAIAKGTDNPCEINVCNNGGTCIHLYDDNVVCSCAIGYRGLTCDDKEFYFTGNSDDPCDPDPCEHGTCKNLNKNTIQCVCDAGYSGRFCDVNPCDADPCKNGGVCFTNGIGYYCACTEFSYGKNCEAVIGCPDTTLLSGDCEDTCSSIGCSTGQICCSNGCGKECMQLVIDTKHACTDNLCQNGATCEIVDSLHYQCKCQSGYTGPFCEQCLTKPKPCDASPCFHGTCYDIGDNYYCVCDTGYSGSTCYHQNYPCTSPNPCVNGFCGVTSEGYKCFCMIGYTGEHCDVSTNPCDTNPCHNHGTCIKKSQTTYTCDCQYGYTGLRCEVFSLKYFYIPKQRNAWLKHYSTL